MMVAAVERTVELERCPIQLPSNGEVALRGKLIGRRTSPRIERVYSHGKWTRVAAVVGSELDRSTPTSAATPAKASTRSRSSPTARPAPRSSPTFACFVRASASAILSSATSASDPRSMSRRCAGSSHRPTSAGSGLVDARLGRAGRRGRPGPQRRHAANRLCWPRPPTTGDASTRFQKAGTAGTVVRENVARGDDEGIHESLMQPRLLGQPLPP